MSIFHDCTESVACVASWGGGQHRHVSHGVCGPPEGAADSRREGPHYPVHAGPGAACVAPGLLPGPGAEVPQRASEALCRIFADASSHWTGTSRYNTKLSVFSQWMLQNTTIFYFFQFSKYR